MQTMTGKAALVTGAGSGIGRAVALAFAQEGAAVMVGEIDETAAEETVALAHGRGGTAAWRRCDVSRNGDVERLVQGTVQEFGHLDFACNIAGIHNPTA